MLWKSRKRLTHQPVYCQNYRLPAWPLDAHQETSPGRIAIMLHVFYPELLDELGSYLQHMPWPIDLLVSVVNEQAEEMTQARLGSLDCVSRLIIRRVVNRGRDIAPLMVTFNKQLRDYDFIGHLHTKKTPYASWGTQWRTHLYDHLLGSETLIRQIFLHLHSSGVGMVYPPQLAYTPCWAMSWLSNASIAEQLCRRMGLAFEPRGCFSFPAGSMFWARREALLPLLDLQLSVEDFPEEAGQQDGTLQHAIERLFGPVCRQSGWHTAVIDLAKGQLDSHDRLNLALYLYEPVSQAVQGALPHFEVVTASVMNALVTRPFTRREAMLRCMAERFESIPKLAVESAETFLELRRQAELHAAQESGHESPSLSLIAQAMVSLGVTATRAQALVEHEAAFEMGLWQLRPSLADSLMASRENILGLVAIANVPLDSAPIQQRLHDLGLKGVKATISSKEVGTGMQQRAFWEWIIKELPITADRKTMHIGSDERNDIQLPWTMDERLTPLYVMEAATLLSLAWQGTPLNSVFNVDDWRDDLWLGLLARRAMLRLDDEPQVMESRRFFDTPQDAGYVLVGPLLLSMLQSWLNWWERFGIGAIYLPVAKEHLAARFYTRLQTVGRTRQKALPALRCRPGGTLARWPMKWLHTPWQRYWFASGIFHDPDVQSGAIQFLDDALAVLQGDWWRFRINEVALETLAMAAAAGDLPMIPELPIAPEHALQTENDPSGCAANSGR